MKLRFNLQVMSLKGLAFDEMVESIYLTGDDGEFELLPFHHPLMASIPEGDLRIAGHRSIPIKVGVLSFKNNQCRIIAEVGPEYKDYKQLWDI
jgi:F0F1-type ATP synthase epsilon subunit